LLKPYILPALTSFKNTFLENFVNLLNLFLFVVNKQRFDTDVLEALNFSFKREFHRTKGEKFKFVEIDSKIK